jgi:hypothetical protein
MAISQSQNSMHYDVIHRENRAAKVRGRQNKRLNFFRRVRERKLRSIQWQPLSQLEAPPRNVEMLAEAFETRATSTVINKIWSQSSLFGRTLSSIDSIFFSLQREPICFHSSKIWYVAAKSIPFLYRLNYVLQRYPQKEKTRRVISERDSRLSAQSADRRLVNKIRSIIAGLNAQILFPDENHSKGWDTRAPPGHVIQGHDHSGSEQSRGLWD